MDNEMAKFTCGICGRKHQMGPHAYEGTFVPRYQIQVCQICYSANWDGWGPDAERKLIPHLTANGLPIPQRNSKGWLPRD